MERDFVWIFEGDSWQRHKVICEIPSGNSPPLSPQLVFGPEQEEERKELREEKGR
jgi:hypothetical protein